MNANGRRLWMHAAGMLTGILFFGMACNTTVYANGVVLAGTSGETDVHTEASDASPVVMKLNRVQAVALEEQNGWTKIQIGTVSGWVETDQLTAGGTAEQAVAAQAEAAQAAALQAAAAQAAEDALLVQKGVSRQDLELLAALIQCEAGGESYVGQVAVGNVVMNRVESEKHPDTISEVIYADGQFSPVRNGSLSRTLSSGNVSASCRQAALEAIAGAEPVGDKLYFRRVNGRSGQVIGNHVFY